MVKCEHCVDEAVCDFCGYYNFNGDKGGVYLDKGWCNKFNRREEPEGGRYCEEFICSQTKEGKELRAIGSP